MRDDYAIAADLCEENRLVEPARLLRQVAEGTGVVFMVRLDEWLIEYANLSGPLLERSHRTRPLFHTREAAEMYAAYLKVALLREHPYPGMDFTYLLAVSEAEFCRQVGAILQVDYSLPDNRSIPIIPAAASDDQIRAIAPLLQEYLVEVVDVPLVLQEGA